VLLVHFSASAAFPQVTKKCRCEAIRMVVGRRDRAASQFTVPRRRRPALSSWRTTVMTEEPPEVTLVTTRTIDMLPAGAREDSAARSAVATPPASARRVGPSREVTPSSKEIPCTPREGPDFAADSPRLRARASPSPSARTTRQHRVPSRLRDDRAAEAAFSGPICGGSPPPSRMLGIDHAEREVILISRWRVRGGV
jgi:hypothetical protein